MDAFEIQGGRQLRGRVRIHGAKNAALPLLAAALLTDEPVTLCDIARVADVESMCGLLNVLGCQTEFTTDNGRPAVKLHVTDTTPVEAPYKIVSTMRAGICVLGPLLARRGMAKVSMPGGCQIGDRPVDLHLRGMKALGALVTLDGGNITAETDKLRGADIFLGGPMGSSVLATINVMSAATLADGITVIESAACEPEVTDVANLLIAMGAKIQGAGSHRITIEGVAKLKGAKHTLIPDRIEAGTYVVAAAITNGDVTLENFPTDALVAALDRMAEIGVHVETVHTNGEGNSGGNGKRDRMRETVRISSGRRLEPVHVVTQPHPGFPTDLQAQLMALLCMADGNSLVTEKIFPDRFLHVPELSRMGANLIRNGASVMVSGVHRLIGAPVMASDLRASACLVLAGLAAKGTTIVNRVYHLDRGYEKMEETLQQLGANIQRIKVNGP